MVDFIFCPKKKFWFCCFRVMLSYYSYWIEVVISRATSIFASFIALWQAGVLAFWSYQHDFSYFRANLQSDSNSVTSCNLKNLLSVSLLVPIIISFTLSFQTLIDFDLITIWIDFLYAISDSLADLFGGLGLNLPCCISQCSFVFSSSIQHPAPSFSLSHALRYLVLIVFSFL